MFRAFILNRPFIQHTTCTHTVYVGRITMHLPPRPRHASASVTLIANSSSSCEGSAPAVATNRIGSEGEDCWKTCSRHTHRTHSSLQRTLLTALPPLSLSPSLLALCLSLCSPPLSLPPRSLSLALLWVMRWNISAYPLEIEWGRRQTLDVKQFADEVGHRAVQPLGTDRLNDQQLLERTGHADDERTTGQAERKVRKKDNARCAQHGRKIGKAVAGQHSIANGPTE